MGDSIVRQWLVLSLLPSPPRKIDAASIEAALRSRRVDVHRRTIQRDLVELSAVFPIIADDRGKPYGWRWSGPFPFASRARQLSGARIVVRLRAAKERLQLVLGQLGATEIQLTDDGPNVTFASADSAIDDHDDVRRLLLSHADHVEVLSPADLRAEIAARATRARDAHAGRAARPVLPRADKVGLPAGDTDRESFVDGLVAAGHMVFGRERHLAGAREGEDEPRTPNSPPPATRWAHHCRWSPRA